MSQVIMAKYNVYFVEERCKTCSQTKGWEVTRDLRLHMVCVLHELECEQKDKVTELTLALLRRRGFTGLDLAFMLNGTTSVDVSDDEFLKEHIRWIKICEAEHDFDAQQFDGTETIIVHIFVLHDSVFRDIGEDSEDEDAPSYLEVTLPSASYDRLWESLIFDNRLKGQLLDYIQSSLIFADQGVDSTIISWNRMMLLYGPPGTGKTSLCKALCHKTAIRLSDRFTHGHFIEINAHSLFSKWFSESGKLVLKMFDKIRGMVENSGAFVFVMIDEVESLTAARNSSLSGSEPSDAIRVVNALLTQIDTLKSYDNVLVMATSNITEAIDSAFLDRADLKVHIGLPTLQARYLMLKSAIEELMRAGVISPRSSFLDYQSCHILQSEHGTATKLSSQLLRVAKSAKTLSGRSLRKLPFIAHALFLQGQHTCCPTRFLLALEQAVERHKMIEAQINPQGEK